jgi:hypothetical protein
VTCSASSPSPRERLVIDDAGIRDTLEAGLPAVYLTLAGTDADAERIAEVIRRRAS